MEVTAQRAARPAWRVWARRLAPWLITGGVVALLLSEYSVSQIVAEMGRGNALGLVPVGLVLVVCTLLLVTSADWVVVRGILGGPGFFVVLRGKAASSLLDIVGYALGHSGYAVWIARRGGTDALTAAGVMLYIMASDLISVCLVATVAVFVGGVDAPSVRIGAPAVAATLLFFKVIGPLRLLGERTPRVFHPWSILSRRRAFLQVGLRTANIYVSVLGVWVAFQVFGLSVPLWAVATYLPVVMLVGSLPINVAGFGAVQAAWLLFEPWASSGEQILAFQFLWTLVVILSITLRGLPFVRRMVSEIDQGTLPDTHPPPPAPEPVPGRSRTAP